MSLPHEVLLIRNGDGDGFSIEAVDHPKDWSEDRYRQKVASQKDHRVAELRAHAVVGDVQIIPVKEDDLGSFISTIQTALSAEIPVGEPEVPPYQILN